MRRIVLGAAFVAIALSADALVHASPATAGSPRPLEPGYSGQLLYRNDNFRTGQNLNESVLTPSNVTPSQFGLVFTDSIDGQAYAQPLYVPAVSIPGQGTHNVIYVETENDSVYAFDADQQGPPLWHTSFIDPANGITTVPNTDISEDCGDLAPQIGITATPVIDMSTPPGTIYVLSKVKLGPGMYQQQLHALDITTGLETGNSPMTIAATAQGTGEDSVNGTITFDPLLQHDRPALTLANGVIYLTFASHCDVRPYHGWILGYDESNLQQTAVFNTTPNGFQGGIWQAGCGPGVDTNGDLIAISGNGTFDTTGTPTDYGDSFIRLTPGVGSFSIASFFTPLNELLLDDEDLDMGSGGSLLLPDQPGPNPHLMIGIGKVGTIYLVNRDSMGGFNASQDQMLQELPHAIGSMFSTPAYWHGQAMKGMQNMFYTIGAKDHPRMFVLNNGMIQTTPGAVGNVQLGFPGASPVISANGTSGGIVWAVDSSGYSGNHPAILYAFDAITLKTLYSSNQFASDNPGTAVKFVNPTVANGSVYVGTQNQLAVFGLFPGGGRPQLKISPLSLSFGHNVRIGKTSSAKTVTIKNTASKKTSVAINVAMESVSSSAFVIDSDCEASLSPGQSCKVSVTFTPPGTTPQSASLMIYDNLRNSPQSVVLTGTGKAIK